MREGTTSMVMAADMPYGEFLWFLHHQYGIFWILPLIFDSISEDSSIRKRWIVLIISKYFC
jgi:hypothetical protein